MYDYLVVGSGLYGAIFSHEAVLRGKSVLVLEKRSHIAGNIYTQEIEGIQVHRYGAHIFHTNNRKIWAYINQFCEFNNFVNSPMANFKGEMYNLPFNMNTFNKMWGGVTPIEAKEIILRQCGEITGKPRNLEEQALSQVGRDIYEKLVKGYTEKQWGRDPITLPSFIIQRLPVRFTYNNNYFSDRYQGIPIGGYTAIVEKLLQGCDVLLNEDYLLNKAEWDSMARKIVYTGPVDAYFGYCYGNLEYRSLRWDTEILDMENFQGNAVVNYTDKETPFTRIIEHKHFEFGTQHKTVISREYSAEWKPCDEPYYPINDERNTSLYTLYAALTQSAKNTIFGGRLAEYRYYDMDKVIQNSLEIAAREFGED